MTSTLALPETTGHHHPLRIAFVAPSRYPIKEPYAGGLEAFCGTMVKELRAQGHIVDLFAAVGSTGHRTDIELPGVDWGDCPELSIDTGYPAGEREKEDRAFIALRNYLVTQDYDVIHNNSLSPWMFPSVASPDYLPMVTTLHTPQLPEMQEAIITAGHAAGAFAAVSCTTGADWEARGCIEIVPNGVDVNEWSLGPGGGTAVWFGRLVPEKGAHLAIDACRQLGLPLVLAGRKGDHAYFEQEIAPRLHHPDVSWVGELPHAQLRYLVSHCAVTVVTPRWEEPFGLVAFESMACGTPVAAFARGGLAEQLADAPVYFANRDSVPDLAVAIDRARTLDRNHVRGWVVERHSLPQTARRYTQLYREVMVR